MAVIIIACLNFCKIKKFPALLIRKFFAEFSAFERSILATVLQVLINNSL